MSTVNVTVGTPDITVEVGNNLISIITNTQGPTGPVGIIWQGAYNGATAYVVDDAVYYNGTSYICIQNGTGQTPDPAGTAYWSVLALKGTDGAGSGDVTGPASAVDSNFVAFNTTTGKLIKDSGFSGSSFLKLDQTTPQSVINGRPTFAEGFKLGLTPTVGSFEEGKIYYDTTYKTPSVNIDTDVNLQVGQETMVRVVNNSGGNMVNGQVVYITGASGVFPTVALAKADSSTTAYVTGVLTQNINDGAEGFITVRGVVNNVNTLGLTAGAEIYLSDTTAGAWTTTAPSAPSVTSRIGKVIVVSATVGSILVNPRPLQQLSALTDVNLGTPIVGNYLGYNGSVWTNLNIPSSGAGVGVDFYNDNTSVVARSTQNTFAIESLSTIPSGNTQVVEAINLTNNTLPVDAYLGPVLGRTQIPAGTWEIDTYASVSSTGGGRVSTISRRVCQVIVISAGTLTTTGTGTSRTATVSGGATPFVAGDANANQTLASYIQTPKGLYQITGFTSSTVVTIATPSAYVNEVGVALSKWANLFGITTDAITATGTNYTRYFKQSFQQAFTISSTDRLGSIIFATSNNTTTVNFVYQGTTNQSHITAPLTVLHNDLPGLQGGSAGQYYHLTSAQATVVANTSGTNSGNETATSIGALIGGAGDATPNNTDYVATSLTAGGILKRITWTNVKAFLKTYFDTLYLTVGSTITLSENTSLALDPAGSADGKYTGITVTGTAGATLAFGDVIVLDVTASKWLLADANSAAAADGDARGLIGMCVLAASDTQPTTILLQGIIRADANFPALTITAPVYLSETAGDIVVAQPVTTDAVIRVLGFALTADEIYFNPSSDYITHT